MINPMHGITHQNLMVLGLGLGWAHAADSLLKYLRGSGLRVQGSGFRVQGSGSRVQGSGFRAQGIGCRVEHLESRNYGQKCGWGVDGSHITEGRLLA